MQSVSSIFTANTQARIRKIFWRCFISFLKDFNASITFFTIGSSTIGGTDIIKGTGSVVQEWDKYSYEEFTNRIIDFEYTREQDPVMGGAILSMADITLSNHDDYFTPGSRSAIDGYVLPYRPIRIHTGFSGESVPIFIGLTEKMPTMNDDEKTVQFHCIDFMQALFNYPLDESVMYQNYRTDQIIGALLQLSGLTSSQYSLDTGFNIVSFFYAEKGDKLGDILRKLAQAELGNIYMDEQGMIRFVNRQNWDSNSDVWTFDNSTVIDRETPKQDDIINVVEVRADVRDVVSNQVVFELVFDPIKHVIPANSSRAIWADFNDPVTGVTAPVYISSATTSSYSTNAKTDGTGDPYNGNITLSATSLFAKSYKMTFTNTASVPVYITSIKIYGTPAPVVKEIYERETDATSISKYDEQPRTIENNYIPDADFASSIGQILIADNKEFNQLQRVTVKGVPQLQIGDVVRLTNEKRSDFYYVQKIVGKMSGAKFVQDLTLVKKTITTYFRIGISTIGGDDKIAP